MLSDLPLLASRIGADERTLRRAVSDGTIHCRRPSPRAVEISEEERAYLTERWSLLASLRAATRTEPNVRLLVLFGSLARGDEHKGSDVDLLVGLADPARGSARLESRIRMITGRVAQVFDYDDLAGGAPMMLAEIVRDGRVIVDRDKVWTRLQHRRPSIEREARRARRARRARLDERLASLTELVDA
jgi:predicted nucleotidyltransferase